MGGILQWIKMVALRRGLSKANFFEPDYCLPTLLEWKWSLHIKSRCVQRVLARCPLRKKAATSFHGARVPSLFPSEEPLSPCSYVRRSKKVHPLESFDCSWRRDTFSCSAWISLLPIREQNWVQTVRYSLLWGSYAVTHTLDRQNPMKMRRATQYKNEATTTSGTTIAALA